MRWSQHIRDKVLIINKAADHKAMDTSLIIKWHSNVTIRIQHHCITEHSCYTLHNGSSIYYLSIYSCCIWMEVIKPHKILKIVIINYVFVYYWCSTKFKILFWFKCSIVASKHCNHPIDCVMCNACCSIEWSKMQRWCEVTWSFYSMDLVVLSR